MEQRLITCIVAHGMAKDIVGKLNSDKGISTAVLYRARGVGYSGIYRSSLTEQVEKDILIALVPQTRADDIFAYLYEYFEIYEPHRGFMYMEKTGEMRCSVLPENAPLLDA